MPTLHENSKRIAKNTALLYVRQVLVLLVSLYTVRVALRVLGAEDYGLYDVVAGTVTVFSFLSGTLTSATQRFFSYELGRPEGERRLKEVFSVNLILYAVMAVLLLLVLESGVLWFVQERLSVPEERRGAVLLIYHLAVVSFFFTLLRTPYSAIMIAHEDMHLFAYVSIIEAVLKLGAVVLLQYIVADKLVVYGALMTGVALVSATIYIVVCNRQYAECQYKKLYWDTDIAKHLASFTGWTLFGQVSTVFRNQAVTIAVNQFFSPIVVAAQAVARNISGAVASFAGNFNTSLYPPIIKYYAAGERDKLYSLVCSGSKLTYFLLWVLALPLILEMELVLSLWLSDAMPEGVLLFSRLALIETLIQSVSLPLTTAARAPGRMKTYELSLGVVQFLIFVATVVAFKLGAPAYSMYIVAIVANVILFLLRVVIVQGLIGLPKGLFLSKTLLPILGISVASALPSVLLKSILPSGWCYSVLVVLVAVMLSCVAMYYIGLTGIQRVQVHSYVRRVRGRR